MEEASRVFFLNFFSFPSKLRLKQTKCSGVKYYTTGEHTPNVVPKFHTMGQSTCDWQQNLRDLMIQSIAAKLYPELPIQKSQNLLGRRQVE